MDELRDAVEAEFAVGTVADGLEQAFDDTPGEADKQPAAPEQPEAPEPTLAEDLAEAMAAAETPPDPAADALDEAFAPYKQDFERFGITDSREALNRMLRAEQTIRTEPVKALASLQAT